MSITSTPSIARSDSDNFTSAREGRFPSETPQAEPRRHFKKNRLVISDASENEKLKTLIKGVNEGNIDAIEQIFFPRKSNEQTNLIYQVVCDLLNDNLDHVQIENGKTFESIQLVYKGKRYPLFQILRKVKWDLIEFSSEDLSKYFEKHNYSKFEEIKSSKKDLYEKLHDLEKNFIRHYTSSSSINSFLRLSDESLCDDSEDSLLKDLIVVAVMCSGLNKIGESKDIKESKYLYRCISSVDRDGLLKRYNKSLDNEKKTKEFSFIGVSYAHPLTGFLAEGYNTSCLKIYVNAEKLAKDISGLSHHPEENECLMLPNTKELFLRAVTYPAKYNLKNKAHIFVTKLLSKRMKIL